MTDYTDLVNWLRDNAVGVVSFRPKFIEAANAIEEQAARIAALEALVKELADTLETNVCAKYVGRKGCPTAKRGEYDDAVEPIRKARRAIAVNSQVKFDSSSAARAVMEGEKGDA